MKGGSFLFGVLGEAPAEPHPGANREQPARVREASSLCIPDESVQTGTVRLHFGSDFKIAGCLRRGARR
jgi:hypothetical protein